MSNPILNVNDNKRTMRDNLKSSYSWYCHLGPANEKRMTELHNCCSLGSFDYESFDKCESFFGKGEHAYGPVRPNTFLCLWSFVH